MGRGAGQALRDDDWEVLRSRLRDRSAAASVGSRLIGLAAELRERLDPAQPLQREWLPLGVDVKEVAMAGRGSCSPGDPRRAIYVNRDDALPLKRFTVAHELAHLLLEGDMAGQGAVLGPRGEEMLCDRFAGVLLVPPEELSEQLGHYGLPPGPDDLLRLCGHFRVNVRPVLFAVGEHLRDSKEFLMLAQYRGHRLRPTELAFRVLATAGARNAYFPPERRLASLGLTRLDERAESAPHGGVFEGGDEDVALELRGLPGRRSSASVRGPMTWRAVRLGRDSPYVVVVLDLAEVPWPQSAEAVSVSSPSTQGIERRTGSIR